MSIIKKVPLRPETFEHKFGAAVLVPQEEDFYHHDTKVYKIPKNNYEPIDPFKELISTVKTNENNIMNNKK